MEVSEKSNILPDLLAHRHCSLIQTHSIKPRAHNPERATSILGLERLRSIRNQKGRLNVIKGQKIPFLGR